MRDNRAWAVALVVLYVVFAIAVVCLIAGGHVSIFQFVSAVCGILGVTCFAVRDKNKRIINAKNVIGFILVTFAAVLFLLEMFLGLSAAMCFVGVCMECMFISLSVLTVVRLVRCNEPVTAKFCGIGHESKGNCNPIFEYTYSGTVYKEKSSQMLRTRYVSKKYSDGESYEIFVYPDNPRVFIAKRRLFLIDIFMMLFAVFAAFVLLMLLFA